MNTTQKLIAICLTSAIMLACATVPFTGRKQSKLLPESMLSEMALAQYTTFLQENKVSANRNNTDLVKTVGNNIRVAVEKYYAQKKWTDKLKNYQWEINLVEDPTVNAWAMPGGKIVVYTGLLGIAKNTDGLAVVMGHEIAHALAHHGNERMSQGLVVQLGGIALSEAVKSKPEATQTIFNSAYGLGANIGVMLPFSRKHESEADEIGLYLMAMAGYDPTEAAPFWERMNAGGGQRPPEFLSTHPDPARRSTKLKELVPAAQDYARKYGTPNSQSRKSFN
jgi:predicted Zn-dependent protease